MILRSTLLLLWHFVREILASDENTTYDSYEFKLDEKKPINYQELINKVNKINRSTTEHEYGTAWEDFTDNTMFLVNLPQEHDSNETTTTEMPNVWNPKYAQFLTFLPDNETTTAFDEENYTTTDLTFFTTHNFTFAEEKRFFEIRDITRDDEDKWTTRDELDDFTDTNDPILIRGNEEFLYPYTNMTSSEEERELRIENFYNLTFTSTAPPPSTWNPFIIQSEERWELDRIAKEKRMATNNMMRDQLKSGNMGGLGGLLGGMIPINLGNLFGGNMKTVTLVVGSKARTTKTTTMTSISTKTFRPRPSPEQYMSWKNLEDGSPRPDMPVEEFIRILKKSGTPPPYYVPPISIPAHVSEDILEQIRAENMTVPMNIGDEQKDRIFNFLNPFIQQHTAMDLINQDKTMGVITAPSTSGSSSTTHTSSTPRTSSTCHASSTSRILHQTYYTIPPDSGSTKMNWKEGWSRITSKTTDPFANENMMKVLNEGLKEDKPWRHITLKTQVTVQNTDSNPRAQIIEKDFDNFYDKKALEERIEQGKRAKEALDKYKEEVRQSNKTKPPYWKEVIARVPEELYETTTEKKGSKSITSERNAMFNWAFEAKTSIPPQHSTPLWFYNTYTTSQPHTTERISEVKYETRRSKWTTPEEDRERLNTILSFMFPYIQKKSDIFDVHHKTPNEQKVDQTTKFNPWNFSAVTTNTTHTT